MKKLSFLLALMMLVAGVLVGCGGSNGDETVATAKLYCRCMSDLTRTPSILL